MGDAPAATPRLLLVLNVETLHVLAASVVVKLQWSAAVILAAGSKAGARPVGLGNGGSPAAEDAEVAVDGGSDDTFESVRLRSDLGPVKTCGISVGGKPG